jgi:phosphatidylglycerol:prolipoprotein diacylglycerol transferase
MLIHPDFNPIAVHIGPLAIRWYGLMYLAGFLGGTFVGKWRARTQPWLHWKEEDVDRLVTYIVFGVILGGRLGYVLFYKPIYYWHHPAEILAVWQGGMSFHGGFLGVLMASALLAKKTKRHWFNVVDFVAPLVPIGLGLGRIGNFINGELPGRPTDVPWAMIFPRVDLIPRHPSQLYEAICEGLIMTLILLFISTKPQPLGRISAWFALLYGSFRFLLEFTRQPDEFLGLLSLGLSMGQWLSLPIIGAGIFLMFWSKRHPVPTYA